MQTMNYVAISFRAYSWRYFRGLITLSTALSLFACDKNAPINAAASFASVEQKIQISPELTEGLASAIRGTPYVALVQLKEHTRIQLNDDLSEESPTDSRIDYLADVLETLRGEPHKQITFYQIVEAGEEPMAMQTPFIISLCHDDTGYYWPGTGSSFPYSEETLSLAKAAAKEPIKSDAIEAYCD